MPTMNVSLPEALSRFVEREVASGAYGSQSEVVREGLRLLLREKATEQEKLAILQREVAIGLEQAKAGQLSAKSVADIVEDVLRDAYAAE